MKKIETKYMMATTAIHKLGDISRTPADICVVNSEDDKNYFGNWVTGFGFIKVKFPKVTTRELTEEEIEKNDGMPMMLSGQYTGWLDITNKKYDHSVVITKKEDGKVRKGTLGGSLKVGQPIVLIKNNGSIFQTTNIISMDETTIRTKNSVYELKFDL